MKTDDPTIPNVLKNLASVLGTAVKHRRLKIPPKFGSGYCAGYVFNEQIRMLISNYELSQDIMLENPDINAARRMIVFKFQDIFPADQATSAPDQVKKMPSVLIATSRLNTDDIILIHTNTATINIEVDSRYLSGMFYSADKSPVLQSLLENTQPFLFEQVIYPSVQKIVDEMVSEFVNETFELFFLRIKAEELICRLLMELEKREDKHLYALNTQDIATVYKVREQMLQHLDTPPLIRELAVNAAMSPTKLKRLFKQIFGDSIFSYYQQFRMKEAALLLKQKKLSVSQVGYELGFTNLSHFSKTFTEHIGMKPKQYAMS
jgi:AraC-like DNA-binding protein